MSYWKWLRGVPKTAASWGTIKGVLLSPVLENLSGFLAMGLFAGFGVGLGAHNSLYYLLFLGLIPSILILLHGQYRDQMRHKGY